MGGYGDFSMIKIFKNEPTSGEFRVGVGVPCHVKDLELLLNYSLPSIFGLDPSPDVIAVNINRGEGGLKKARADLYEALFHDYNCDVLFNMSADMIVFSDALKYVDRDRIVSYGPIFKTPISTTISLIFRLLLTLRGEKSWRGTYSLPREVWYDNVIGQGFWNGSDSNIRDAVNSDFIAVPIPKVMIVRKNYLKLKQVTLFHPLNKKINPIKKFIKLSQALPF